MAKKVMRTLSTEEVEYNGSELEQSVVNETKTLESTANKEALLKLNKTKKKLNMKKPKKNYTFRFDEDLMNEFKLLCEAAGSDVSKELTRSIKLMLEYNKNLVNMRK